VAKGIAQDELRSLALVGARARYADLRSQMTALLKTFPELGRAGAVAPAGRKRKAGRKSPMSASERRQVSERMKKYWAERRAARSKK
jgi:hypothetical protein